LGLVFFGFIFSIYLLYHDQKFLFHRIIRLTLRIPNYNELHQIPCGPRVIRSLALDAVPPQRFSEANWKLIAASHRKIEMEKIEKIRHIGILHYAETILENMELPLKRIIDHYSAMELNFRYHWDPTFRDQIDQIVHDLDLFSQ
jgi:hypothetical protein